MAVMPGALSVNLKNVHRSDVNCLSKMKATEGIRLYWLISRSSQPEEPVAAGRRFKTSMSQVQCLHVQGPLAVHAIHKGERRKETLSWGRALIIDPSMYVSLSGLKKARICLDLHEQLENRLRGGQLRLWE